MHLELAVRLVSLFCPGVFHGAKLLVSFRFLAPVLAPSEWVDESVGGDHSTGQFGYVWPLGQSAGQSILYALPFDGRVSFGPSSVTVKSGAHYEIYTNGIIGPLCGAGSSSFPSGNPCSNNAFNPLPQYECGVDSLPDVNALASQFSVSLLYQISSSTGLCSADVDVTRVFYENVLSLTNAFVQCEVTLHVRDTTPPVVSGADLFETISCTQQLPPLPTVTATDACQGPITVPAPCQEQTNGTCPNNNFYLRTWTATDACGRFRYVCLVFAFGS